MKADNNRTVLWDLPKDQTIFYADEICGMRKNLSYEIAKRSFDFFASAFLLVMLFIPMSLISALIVYESPGNPIYSQIRLGKDQKPFRIYKFRTMFSDAEENGLKWADNNDERVTSIGSVLRQSRMDELPQLWNILCGQMSFVGPRPERPEFYDIFDKYIVGFRQRMLVKPGLTGLAQVNGGYDLLPEEKIVFDLEYIKTQSILIDVRCLLKTVGVVLFHKGVR